MPKNSRYKWESNLVKASFSNSYAGALDEWLCNGSSPDIKSDKANNCLCGAKIHNAYFIINNENGNVALAGAKCKNKLNNNIKKGHRVGLSHNRTFEKVEYDELNLEEYLSKCKALFSGMRLAFIREKLEDERLKKIKDTNRRLLDAQRLEQEQEEQENTEMERLRLFFLRRKQDERREFIRNKQLNEKKILDDKARQILLAKQLIIKQKQKLEDQRLHDINEKKKKKENSMSDTVDSAFNWLQSLNINNIYI
jgi:hypothetical protein